MKFLTSGHRKLPTPAPNVGLGSHPDRVQTLACTPYWTHPLCPSFQATITITANGTINLKILRNMALTNVLFLPVLIYEFKSTRPLNP
jgi:hypothetical protein